MNEKKLWIIFISFILIFIIGSFFAGYFVARRGSDIKITQLEETITGFGTTVTELNSTIKSTDKEVERLEELERAYIRTISTSEETISESERITSKQRDIIKELASRSSEAGEASGTIAIGLKNAVESVDKIIEFIQMEDD